MDVVTPEGDGVRLLSLDGGDARCLSQLVILEELMTRLKHDLGKDVRPCEYFQLITGTGAAGVLAILLGVLGLSIDKTIEFFGQICDQVFPVGGCTANERSSRLENAMGQLLSELNIPHDAKLQGDSDISAGCRVSICYSAAITTGCRMFRNCTLRNSSYNPTIVEAARAAWAVPGLFSPIHIGANGIEEELVSATNGFNNPTRETLREAQSVFGKDRMVSSVLSIGSGKRAAVPASSVAATIQVAQETEITAENLQRMFGTLGIYFRFSVERGIDNEHTNLANHLASIMTHTKEYLDGDIVSRALDSYIKVSGKTSTISLERLCQSKAGGFKSSHWLPPLSAFFIMRQEPLDKITAVLGRKTQGSPPTALVIGLSGTGKTQITLKYAYDNDEEYDHILFIDANSAESIEKSLVTRIRTIDRQLHPKNTEEALNLLINPEGNLTRNWLIIMDNADDPTADLRNYMPSCGHGHIIVTSRNAALVDLYPDGYVAMDVMSSEEAVEALLSAALGPQVSTTAAGPRMEKPQSIPRTEKDRESAIEIVQDLGCLPLAVIQAACYVKKHKCLHDYAGLLKTSRSKILRWPASVQRDKLKYAHSTYAAFDTTLNALSSRGLKFLGIISFVHYSDFPRNLIQLAASLQFAYQPYDLLDRPPEYQQSIDLLKEVFCPRGCWDQTELDALLEELQHYSLVTLVPVATVVTLRFHPLLHSWAKDRLSDTEAALFSAAAVRLLVCGTGEDDEYLRPFLSHHVGLFGATYSKLHVNDQAALALIPRTNEQNKSSTDIWERILTEVKAVHGERHLRTTRSMIELAEALTRIDKWSRVEELERKALEIRKEDLGENHLETALAMAALSSTCRARDRRYDESMQLGSEALRVRRELLGPNHRLIVESLRCLAETHAARKEFTEAQARLTEALEMIIALVGEAHVATIKILEKQADYYSDIGNKGEAIRLETKSVELRRKVHGVLSVSTLDAMHKLASSYSNQSQHQEAEKVWREVFDRRRELLGAQHSSTLLSLYWVARATYDQKRCAEAEVLFREVMIGQESTLEKNAHDTLDTMSWVSWCLYEQERYAPADELWAETVQGWRTNFGVGNSETVDNIFWHGLCKFRMKRYTEAESLWTEALAGYRGLSGNQHWNVLSTAVWLGRAILDQARYSEAEALFKQAGDTWRAASMDENMDSLSGKFWMAKAIFSQDRFAEAEEIWREVAPAWRDVNQEPYRDTLETNHWVARCVYAQKRYGEAEKLFGEDVIAYQTTFGEQDESTLRAREWLAKAKQALAEQTAQETLGNHATPSGELPPLYKSGHDKSNPTAHENRVWAAVADYLRYGLY